MSDTDTTYSLNGPAPRPSALGDLRFAGTIATGLVAGTLGLGALAAPLVGWKDWPSGLEKDAATTPVRLAKPNAQQPPAGTRENGPGNGGGEESGPNGAAPILVSIPGTGAGGSFPIVAITGPGTSESSARDTEDGAPRSTARTGTGTGSWSAPAFPAVDTGDDDGDQIPNDYERTVLNTDSADANDGTASNGYGVSNSTEFRVKANFPAWDTNGNGVVDGEDDSDGDGVPNAVEEANGSDPANGDTNGDGIPDGMEDWNNDGTPDSLPPTTAPVEEPEVEEPPVVETPAPQPEETPAPPVETTPAPETETPAPPVAETPAPEAPAEEQVPETEPAPEPAAPAATAEAAPVEEEAPAPVEEEAPAPVEEEAPAPAPAPVEEEAPAPAPAPVQEEAPAPAPEAPAPAAEAPVAEAPAAAPAEPAPAPAEQPAEDPAATPAW